MAFPEFSLKHLPEVLGSGHETGRTALGLGGRDARTNPSPSSGIGEARITEWARASGRYVTASDFAQRLDGSQVDSEIAEIFRDTPEFGRSLAVRLADFHNEESKGRLTLIGGGGESVVFGDPEDQRVYKLLSPAGRANFGWMIERDAKGSFSLRAGSLAECLHRYWLAEKTFPTGLEIDAIGGADQEFLILSQPFLVGTNPTAEQLSQWMRGQGWQPFVPPSNLQTLANLTWQKGDFVATDVRPENAILAESDGGIYPFDFILGDRRFLERSGHDTETL